MCLSEDCSDVCSVLCSSTYHCPQSNSTFCCKVRLCRHPSTPLWKVLAFVDHTFFSRCSTIQWVAMVCLPSWRWRIDCDGDRTNQLETTVANYCRNHAFSRSWQPLLRMKWRGPSKSCQYPFRTVESRDDREKCPGSRNKRTASSVWRTGRRRSRCGVEGRAWSFSWTIRLRTCLRSVGWVLWIEDRWLRQRRHLRCSTARLDAFLCWWRSCRSLSFLYKEKEQSVFKSNYKQMNEALCDDLPRSFIVSARIALLGSLSPSRRACDTSCPNLSKQLSGQYWTTWWIFVTWKTHTKESAQQIAGNCATCPAWSSMNVPATRVPNTTGEEVWPRESSPP